VPAPRLFVLGFAVLLGSSCSEAESGENPGAAGTMSSSAAGSHAAGGTGGSGMAPSGAAGAKVSAAGSGSSSNGNTAGGSTVGGSESAGGSGGTSGAAAGGTPSTGGAPLVGPIECRASGDGKSTITLINHCGEALTFAGSDIEGGLLQPGEHACRDVGDAVMELPAIRFWGYIGMDPGGERYTLAELTLNTDFNDFDWYNISHVDAHNLPMQVSAFEKPNCRTLTCADSLIPNCPAEGQLKDAQGKVISCFSPNRDDANSTVAKYFEAGCADAYSWSGDDQESVVACAGEDYDVVFCP
jgi:hypothetical protein